MDYGGQFYGDLFGLLGDYSFLLTPLTLEPLLITLIILSCLSGTGGVSSFVSCHLAAFYEKVFEMSLFQ